MTDTTAEIVKVRQQIVAGIALDILSALQRNCEPIAENDQYVPSLVRSGSGHWKLFDANLASYGGWAIAETDEEHLVAALSALGCACEVLDDHSIVEILDFPGGTSVYEAS